jgi:hypothetical protein
MKDRKKFYVKMIIFHLILYPGITWFLVSGLNDIPVRNFIIGLFSTGGTISMLTTCILPLTKLRKEEKRLESQRITNGNINDYIN